MKKMYSDFHFNNALWGRGKFFEHENEKKVKFIGDFIQSMIDEIGYLSKELERINAENAKDERVAAAEAKAEEAQQYAAKAFDRLRMGFTEEDMEKEKQWWLDHTAEEREELAKQKRPLGKAAHRSTYKIIPTELGTIKKVECSCGATLDLTDDAFFG